MRGMWQSMQPFCGFTGQTLDPGAAGSGLAAFAPGDSAEWQPRHLASY